MVMVVDGLVVVLERGREEEGEEEEKGVGKGRGSRITRERKRTNSADRPKHGGGLHKEYLLRAPPM